MSPSISEENMRSMDTIAIVDFGGQYSHLIGRRIRDIGVFAKIFPADVTATELREVKGLKGIIFSGGASSVYEEKAPNPDPEALNLNFPVLGICYGHQLIAQLCGGTVETGEAGEYGTTLLSLTDNSSKLLDGFNQTQEVWMNHSDRVIEMPSDFTTIGKTKISPVAAFANEKRGLFGVQFHPEVTHTERGNLVLENFTTEICNARREWDPSNLVTSIIKDTKSFIGERKAIIGLSGGVDSSTAARIVGKAIGKNLTAVYVDTGLMRKGETSSIIKGFSEAKLNLKIVDAKDRFLSNLSGVKNPEKKRKIIGRTFIDSFTEVASELGAQVLIQGTIYSDRIESGVTTHSDTIKSHHNVGGIPEEIDLDIYEPLRDLYKDEVRRIASELNLPNEIVNRHVFPGPGLAIRIVGEVTPERVEVVREASYIVEQQLQKANLYHEVWMAFAVLLPIKSVGVQGDTRSYRYPVAVRVVESEDAMTANFAQIPYPVLENISTKITNEIPEVNRVVYDISNKPPSTMEWE